MKTHENPIFLQTDEKVRNVSMAELVPLFQEQLEMGRSVRFAPRGVSMLPMLRPGLDTVVLSPAPERLKKFDLPLYQRDNGHYVLHRVVKAGETYICVGDNQFQLETGIRREQIIGLVTGFRRNGRDYSMEHPGYRLYCRLWHYSRDIRHVCHRAKGWIRRHIR